MSLPSLLFLLVSCAGSSNRIPGVEKASISVSAGQLFVSLIATSLDIDGGLSLPVPGLEGSVFTMAPNAAGPGAVIQFTVPLRSISRGDPGTAHSGLPDGRPLPGVTSGRLPRWDVQLGSVNLSLYMARDVFGVFLPLKLISLKGAVLARNIVIPIRDSRGNVLGKVFAIPSYVSGQTSGIYLLLPYLGGSQRT